MLSARLRSHEQRCWRLRSKGELLPRPRNPEHGLRRRSAVKQLPVGTGIPSSQPDWLTDDFYKNQIQPRLTNITLSQIASAIDVSILYASDIRRGRRRPHPRHWEALVKLVGVV